MSFEVCFERPRILIHQNFILNTDFDQKNIVETQFLE